MASVSLCCSARPAAHFSKLGFHQIPNYCRLINSSSINLHSTSVFRFKNASKLLIGKRLPLVHASNKPSEEPIGNTEAITSNGTSTTAPGPPFLTILAGILVFALILWVIGTVVSWLIGLVGLVLSK